jgi:hypothetical protein
MNDSEKKLRANIEAILETAAESKRQCKLCPAFLYFVRSYATGVHIPFEADGTNHWKNCPGTDRIKAERKAAFEAKRKPAPKQQQLLDTKPEPWG